MARMKRTTPAKSAVGVADVTLRNQASFYVLST